jgi:regulator of protease activity HflC (stomatin/prohibitin superfamily)
MALSLEPSAVHAHVVGRTRAVIRSTRDAHRIALSFEENRAFRASARDLQVAMPRRQSMGSIFEPVRAFLRKTGYVLRAAAWATALGFLETLRSERGRRTLAVAAIAAAAAGLFALRPVRSVAPGEVGVRINRLTGAVSTLREGWVLALPAVHELRLFPLRDQIYRPLRSARADAEAPFQTIEGLSIGVDVAVRYALDPTRVVSVAEKLPAEVGRELVEPAVDGVLHRVFARATVREIFAAKRAEIQKQIEDELRQQLLPDGIIVRAVFLGNVDLPKEYRAGLESLLSEELSAEKMRFTLELKDEEIKQASLEAEAEKVKREKAAEAAGLEEIIAARSRAEAMKHVLPFKQKEIEQRRLEAEAAKVARLKQAEAEAEARRIEASGEADSRRKLAEAEAFRIDATGKAQSAQLERDSALLLKNPLLIQKTLADKLSDKIQVIIAPPQAGGFFAAGLLGQSNEKARAEGASDALAAQGKGAE